MGHLKSLKSEIRKACTSHHDDALVLVIHEFACCFVDACMLNSDEISRRENEGARPQGYKIVA